MARFDLHPELLMPDAFAAFGDVITPDGAEQRVINDGTTVRYHDLANIDVAEENGHTLVNIFRGAAVQLPLRLWLMERHPIGSQVFWPLSNEPFLIVVAPAGQAPGIDDLRAFHVPAGTGVNYAKGVWHHPLIPLNVRADFMVIDRGGDGHNLDEMRFPDNTDVMLHGYDAA
jgi:ureidoglycolate lyase